MIDDASNNVFKKKDFTCNGKTFSKTPIYNFFDGSTNYDTWPENPIEFTCLVCLKVLREKLGESTYLTQHLRGHQESVKNISEWFHLYDISKDNKNGIILLMDKHMNKCSCFFKYVFFNNI